MLQNKLHLFDHKSGKELEFPKIEDGTIQGVTFQEMKIK